MLFLSAKMSPENFNILQNFFKKRAQNSRQDNNAAVRHRVMRFLAKRSEIAYMTKASV